MPLVVYHPTKDGQNVSARRADVLEESGVGMLLNAQIVEGKLKAEAWFDGERTRQVDSRILNRLQRNEPIEVSTGLFVDATPVDGEPAHNGVRYTHVARNLRPDHLAILPDQVGACSLKDGCGILANLRSNNMDENDKKTIWQRLGEALGILTNKEVEGTSTQQTTISTQGSQQVELPATPIGGNEAMAEKLADTQRQAIVNALIAQGCCYDEKDKPILNALSDDALVMLQSKAAKEAEKEKERRAVENAAQKTLIMDSQQQQQTTTNAQQQPKQLTEQEWLAMAPPSVQAQYAETQRILNTEKAKIVETLVNQAKESDRPQLKTLLESMTVNQLRPMAALVVEPKQVEQQQPLYVGASAPTGKAAPTINRGEYLPIPEIDWTTAANAK